ncbi:glycosyl transferase [Lacticaseibacillus chiayiensis]|uniref:Glycosyl transferase n=1 Tax=Lacticaseibacillus chiayiensis TaxID=2100821 RepID=A0A4Q1TPJ7_9LACO|nr:glycosyltransferase [Lacticaseibacillus chiayiensis]RXT20494.1 glycosyl transferase [Lacticaseibacillus chiayiensis]
MNFFINAAMGMGNSGVEHAEFYRAKRFDQVGIPYRLVFLDLIRELHPAMDRWHLRDDQVIDLWEYLVLGDDYLKNGLEKRMTPPEDKLVIDGTNTHRKREYMTDSGMMVVEHYVKYPDIHHPENKVLMVGSGRVELFDVASGKRRVMYEIIDDENRGRIIANIHLYDQRGKHLFFRNALLLYRYFFAQLDAAYGAPSHFIIDRGENTDQALMNYRLPESKLIYMIHADQLSDRDDPKNPLWNNHYEFLFDHLSAFDRVVVATELQRKDMLIDFPNDGQRFVTIPVGGVSDEPAKITPRELKEPIRLMTASRLASEKHIDLIVHAVAKLHNQGHDVRFDIYGQGSEDVKIKKAIEQENAQDYVVLKGLSDDLADVYPQYDVFISASFSEGFGLTYIEALNAGLPIVTFKARFGALELVKDGQNGFLQDFKREDDEFDVEQLMRGIERLMKSDYAQLQKNTQISVASFQDHVIAGKWRKLIDAL